MAFLAATVAIAAKLRGPTAAFRRAKALTALTALLAFGLRCIVVMGIAGEWFVMWQSHTWNGQDAAFMFYMTALVVAICVFLDNDGEVGNAAD